MEFLSDMDDLILRLQEWPTAYVLVPAALILLFLAVTDLSGSWWKRVMVKKSEETKETQDIAVEDDGFASMGSIEPFNTSDWENIPPRKIYKFKPKYFLTMGSPPRLGWIFMKLTT